MCENHNALQEIMMQQIMMQENRQTDDRTPHHRCSML
jgi:hypothetical protein